MAIDLIERAAKDQVPHAVRRQELMRKPEVDPADFVQSLGNLRRRRRR
jgi:hypothetical protein